MSEKPNPAIVAMKCSTIFTQLTQQSFNPSRCRQARPVSRGVLLGCMFLASAAVVVIVAAQPESPPWVAPDSANARSNPIAANSISISRGKELYQAACLPCHGTKGAGDGPAAPTLERHPGILSDPKLWLQPDGAIFWKLSEGRSPMPSFKEGFSENQMWDVVNYVRTLAPKPKEGMIVAQGPKLASPATKSELPSAPATSARAAQAPAEGEYVSRAEHEKLRHAFEQVQLQVQELLRQLGTPTQTIAQPSTTSPASMPSAAIATSPASPAPPQSGQLEQEVSSLKKIVDVIRGGSSKHLFSGYAFAGYEDRTGESGTFNAGFNPIFLWKPVDRLFFESELELELANGETELSLEYAHLNYSLNDYVTLGAGKFLSPFGMFRERLHPAWINKLPDGPLAYGHDGIIPPTILGAQIRGGIPVGQARMHYSFYVGNGPELNTGADEPDEAGMLHFNNYDDFQKSKAAGGRLGFLPFPELEIGYSGQYSKLDVEGTSQASADAWLHGPYVSYVRDSDRLKGVIDVKAEWAWSMVNRLTYDPTGSLGFGPLTYDNWRSGGYAQLAYRPSKLPSPVLRNLEGVFRFDRLDWPSGSPESADENRYTYGLNYWLSPTTVFKAAYQFGDRKEPGMPSENITAFLIQAAMGF